jgi:hypothetical protein
VSDLKDRHEGIRIKHRVGRNSIKAYNKQGSILRVETTINDPAGFKVFRPTEGGDDDKLQWLPMRKGIADLKRRADVSQQANERYLEAMAVVDVPTPLKRLVGDLLKPAKLGDARVRALNPWSPDDTRLLRSVMRGEFAINGFRNRDLRGLLFDTPARTKDEEKRRSGRVSRQLRMLRAHGLIRKIPRSHRYQLTDKGRNVITALIAASEATVEQLTRLAA